MTPVPPLSIAAVESDTGLSKETLRMWERRYGFPQPQRSARGDRHYPAEQVQKLRLMKKLMDLGARPGSIITASLDELQGLASREFGEVEPGLHADDARGLLALVKTRDVSALRVQLRSYLARLGIRAFVGELIGPLNTRVGNAWASGQISAFEEHLYSEQVESVLRHAADLVANTGGLRILLTTVPGEQHKLGLLMLEALLSSEGATCLPLGTQTPAGEIVASAAIMRADVVALSFSGAFPRQSALRELASLRSRLPQDIGIWAGGTGLARVRTRIDGVLMPMTFDAAVEELHRLRQSQPVR